MIFGINTTRYISKLSQISLAYRLVKLRITISKYHSWYLCHISLQIMLLPILTKCLWGVVGKSFRVILYCYEPFNSLLIIQTAFFNALSDWCALSNYYIYGHYVLCPYQTLGAADRQSEFEILYYCMRNFCKLIALERWYFSLI